MSSFLLKGVQEAHTVIECVPNISTANKRKVEAVTQCARAAGVTVLETSASSCQDHNRTVITLAGSIACVTEAAFVVAKEAARLIDMSAHKGVHPCIGALDVLPFVPLRAADMPLCINAALFVGERIANELNIPVFLYGFAAKKEPGRTLADIRRGGFNGLFKNDFNPDFGTTPHPSAGAFIVGARHPLIAYNVNLDTTNINTAKEIAKIIRGEFCAVKTLGLYLNEKNTAQVSMNLTDYTKTTPIDVFYRIQQLAAQRGVSIRESELIGLMPLAAIDAKNKEEAEKTALELKIKDFSYKEHILEANGFAFK